jgi:hypothetical protein
MANAIIRAGGPGGGPKEDLNQRLTLRLPNDLSNWVREQGGSSFIRELLIHHRSNPVAGSPGAAREWNKHWEHIVDEREALEHERELLQDEERLLDRRRDRLDDERRLLDQRRELLEEEWSELEDARDVLQAREEMLGAAWTTVSLCPATLLDIAGLTLRQTKGHGLV